MYWRRFAVSEIPLDDAKAFETWLSKRWDEKDQLLEQFQQSGRFPADTGGNTGSSKLKGAGYIDTEVKLAKWYEIGQIFVVLATLALIADVFSKLWALLSWPFRLFIKG